MTTNLIAYNYPITNYFFVLFHVGLCTGLFGSKSFVVTAPNFCLVL